MARRDSILTKPHDTRGALRRLLRYLGQFRLLILLVAAMCVCAVSFSSAPTSLKTSGMPASRSITSLVAATSE